MFNTLDFPEGKRLLPPALRAAKKIAQLKSKLKRKAIPVIYVNNNFGQWRSDWAAIYEICQAKKCLGHPLAKALKPDSDDYFVLKPKHSAFFSTSLDVLLEQIGARHLIITGIAADICILFSVHDAYIRNFEVTVPADCVAAETPARKRTAIRLMKKIFKIRTATP
jgi:nicotinamidase-related amidase